MEALRRPEWWSEDVPFDVTGETQRGWARAAAAAYRALYPERYGVTPSVTESVTPPKSVTSSVTSSGSVTEGVTSKKDRTAARVRRWREKQRKEAQE